jgi:hypothetical protein
VTLVTPQKLTLQSTGDTDITASGDVSVTAPSISLGASGSPKQALMNQTFLSWFTSTVMPFLVSKGFTGAVPSGSATQNVEAS